MKKNIWMAIIVAAVAIFAGVAMATPNINPCSVEEAARFQASHVITVDYTDIATASGTATNTTVAFTNTVTAPCSIRFMCYDLFSSFDTAPGNVSYNGTNATFNKTYTNAMTVSCGTNTATTLWINGVQAAADQTPTVYGSYGAAITATASGVTNPTVTVTNPNLLESQTSDVNIVTTFTYGATGTNVWSNLVKGRAKFYFEIIGKKTTR